ncbi:MAG: helix-turn-helix domain-containing protein [Acidimicrobiales bacterium]
MSGAGVLAALMRLQARDGRATVPAVAAEAGVSRANAHGRLVVLRNAGLVAWEPETAGTLRPLVAPIVERPDTPRLPDGTVDVRAWCAQLDEHCNEGLTQ